MSYQPGVPEIPARMQLLGACQQFIDQSFERYIAGYLKDEQYGRETLERYSCDPRYLQRVGTMMLCDDIVVDARDRQATAEQLRFIDDELDPVYPEGQLFFTGKRSFPAGGLLRGGFVNLQMVESCWHLDPDAIAGKGEERLAVSYYRQIDFPVKLLYLGHSSLDDNGPEDRYQVIVTPDGPPVMVHAGDISNAAHALELQNDGQWQHDSRIVDMVETQASPDAVTQLSDDQCAALINMLARLQDLATPDATKSYDFNRGLPGVSDSHIKQRFYEYRFHAD